MKRRRVIASLMMLSLAAFLLPCASALEKRAPVFSSDPAAVGSRLDNVRRLVTSSSGARRIIEGSDDKAKQQRNEAELHLRAAEKAYEKGDIAESQTALQKATEKMFSSIRQIGTGKDGVDKQTRDFANKAESVDVLLTAIERVANEKGGMQNVLDKAADIRVRAGGARAIAARGDLSGARSKLDAVYEDAKLELERLREGETLVRTLNFASKEEEYHYELDRNDTHRMLLQVLLSDRKKSAGVQNLIDNYVGRSSQLRDRAEGEAGNGAFGQAVDSLEEATKYLQRAIRSAGVYIPG